MDAMPALIIRSLVVLAISLAAHWARAQTLLPEPLRFLATHSLFERIKAEPGFDLSSPATFGYFFEAQNEADLQSLRTSLESQGYVFVSQHVARSGMHVLQVAKVEVHTVDSLVERNRALFALAAAKSQATYTGWDITRNKQ